MNPPTPVIAETGPDAGVAWHYGDPMREQRSLDARGPQGAGAGSDGAVVDLSHRGVLTVSGPDRLSWLHSLSSQHLENLAVGVGTTGLILSPQGHLEHAFYGVDDGETFWAHTEPGAAGPLVEWLDRMRFMMRVEVADRSADVGLVWRPGPVPADADVVVRTAADSLGGSEFFVPRDRVAVELGRGVPAGMWAYEARRIAAGVPRIGIDTDPRTIPNEVGLLGVAVHLAKGCYRGQETVARVHTLGRPPRRLVRLQLDGSVERLPGVGAAITADGRPVGFVGSSARHFEDGPIALGLIKRNTAVDAVLEVDGIAAAQEVLVDPEVGEHVRARL